MKKYIKYLSSFLLMFVALISSVSAVTIKETLIEGDGYSTIEDGSIVIGVTKFHSDVVVTGGRATKAGSDAAVIHLKLNGNLDDFETPVIYVYAGGAWFALDKNNDASVVEDQAILDDLSNKDIYYVNDEEKLLDIDVSGINIDTSKLPKGVTYKDGKIWVKATKDTVTVLDKNGAEYKFVKDRGLWGLDQSECYEVNGREIIGYSNTCSKDVIVPSKVGDTEIVSVGADAFRNKGIKTVIIPNHIMGLGNNAFADNSLESVTIEDKYDESDFDYYGENVFGSFKNEDIIWKNDLTDFANQFNDEVTIKVTKETLAQEEDEYYKLEDRLASFVGHSEINRLGLTLDENGRINNKYIAYFYPYYEGSKIVPNVVMAEFCIFDENEYTNWVSKKITYNVQEVDANNKNYEKIYSEYLSYFDGIKDKVKNKEFDKKLTGTDGILDIVDKYNYEVLDVYSGIGDGPVTDDNVSETQLNLIYDDTLYYLYEIPFYTTLIYDVTVDSKLETNREIYDAMKEKFKEESGFIDFEVTNEHTNSTAEKVDYYVNLEENTHENTFVIMYKKEMTGGTLFFDTEYIDQKYYTYFPKKSYLEFDGTMREYFEYAVQELYDEYNIGDGYNYRFDNYPIYNDSLNSSNKYEVTYSIVVSDYDEENNISSIVNIYVKNETVKNFTKEFFEAFIDIPEDMEKIMYEQEILNAFFSENNSSNYFINESYTKYFYNEESSSYKEKYQGEGTEKLYSSKLIFDFETNTQYIIIYKDFEDREPGTIFLDNATQDEYRIYNNYNYIPLNEYRNGKVSDYVESLKNELKEKANLDDTASFDVRYNSSDCQGDNKCDATYEVVYSVYGDEESNYYRAYFKVPTNIIFEYNFKHTSTVEPKDFNSQEMYDNMVFSECINGLGLTDYFYSIDNKYYLDEEYVEYELFDFENNRRIMIKAKRFVLE